MIQIFIEDISQIYTDKTIITKHINLLSKQEKERFNKINRQKQKLQFLLGRFLIRTKLAEILNKDASNIDLVKLDSGRLELKDNTKNISFNISHSNDLVAVALAKKPIGIDIEFMKKRDFDNIAESSFSKDEANSIKNLQKSSDKKQLFYKYWTIHEASIKCPEKECAFISYVYDDKYALSISCKINKINSDNIIISSNARIKSNLQML